MVAADNHELIASDAVDPVVIEAGTHRIRKFAQRRIALGMPQMVVDFMQSDHVDVHHRQRLVMRGLDVLQVVIVGIAVEQPRQRVPAVIIGIAACQ